MSTLYNLDGKPKPTNNLMGNSIVYETQDVVATQPKPETQVDKGNQFQTIYFTGAQTRIQIGEYYLDDIAEVEGLYQYGRTPIYSYASKHFNTAAQGRVFVTGSLIINFRFDGYLYAFIKAASSDGKNGRKVIDDLLKSAAPPSQVIKQIERREGNSKDYINATVNKYTSIQEGINDNDIKAFQETYWNSEKPQNFLSADARPEFRVPFDIIVKDFRVGYDNENYQERTIKNCFLTSNGSVRRVDDSPVVEVYQFIAQSII
jgi:hypothetical protein